MATLADAIELAGRSVIYAGKELSPEVWTCPLLAAQSKILSETILRLVQWNAGSKEEDDKDLEDVVIKVPIVKESGKEFYLF